MTQYGASGNTSCPVFFIKSTVGCLYSENCERRGHYSTKGTKQLTISPLNSISLR